MIKVENIETYGWLAAIRGMRNPKNSWENSDSTVDDRGNPWIGKNDLKLMKTLANAGSDHGKFLRMITITMDITAPLYFLKEFDTYKVGTVANSCSTMHKITSEPITKDSFCFDFTEDEDMLKAREFIIGKCEEYRQKFIETGDKGYWRELIQILPSAWMQKRTVQLNYAVAWNMYQARKNHKLIEWHWLLNEFRHLPYFSAIFNLNDENNSEKVSK